MKKNVGKPTASSLKPAAKQGNQKQNVGKRTSTFLEPKGRGNKRENTKNLGSFNNIDRDGDYNIEDDDEALDQHHRKNQEKQLTDLELNENMPSKMLQPNNPQATANLSVYSFKDRKYYKEELVDQQVIHFSMDGDHVLKDSNEARIHEDIAELRNLLINEAIRQHDQEDPGAPKESIEVIKKTMRNKFNYNERQVQTFNFTIRERGVSTQPPPNVNFAGEITQWEMYDAYVHEFRKEFQKKTEKKSTSEHDGKQETSLYSTSFKRCLKIMDRMVVNNDQSGRYDDYKYYFTRPENQDIGKTEGNMLLIWRFFNDKQRKKHVTSLCWNPRYPDLFAVGLGSYDFLRQRTGLICLYSLKNTTYPEYSFSTESGVMCLDFHPNSPALIAVGLYDGTVLVYDIRNKHKKPIYMSTVRTKKHTDPVWQVRWNPDITKSFNFYSISSDGRVMNWILMKNKLEPEEVIRLKLTGRNSDEETTLIGLASGICFDFNKFEPHIFIVGTEEGKIYKCSRAYSGQYLEVYKGHFLAVYKVRWNTFHPRVFISASADWTVKIWDSKSPNPIMSFDLSMQVVDAIWAPYSSTVFACATLEKVWVYDLNIDKHGRLSEQKTVKNAKITNLSFNYRDPIVIVGDNSGGVTLVKLSPNLTKGGKVPEDKEGMSIDEYERSKMDELINVAGKWEKDDG